MQNEPYQTGYDAGYRFRHYAEATASQLTVFAHLGRKSDYLTGWLAGYRQAEQEEREDREINEMYGCPALPDQPTARPTAPVDPNADIPF